MGGFWSCKKPAIKVSSADNDFKKKMKELDAIEETAYQEYFNQYTKLLTNMAATIKQSIQSKHKNTPYAPIVEEIYKLAMASIEKRQDATYLRAYIADRKYDSELYNDLLALNDVLNSPSSESMAFLFERAKQPWFDLRAETWNDIGVATFCLAIGLLVAALAISFAFVVFTSTLIGIGFLIEVAGGLGSVGIMGVGLLLQASERDSNLLQIEYNLHDFANLYQQHNEQAKEDESLLQVSNWALM